MPHRGEPAPDRHKFGKGEVDQLVKQRIPPQPGGRLLVHGTSCPGNSGASALLRLDLLDRFRQELLHGAVDLVVCTLLISVSQAG